MKGMMRRAVLLPVSMAVAVLLASGVALALPSETPDATPMLNGPVRTIEKVGNNIWVGGNFTQVKQRDGSVIDNVSNVAVFNATTGAYVNIAPRLGAGSTTTNVRDIAVYGTNNVVIGGDFSGPTTSQKNLVVVDGTTGGVVRWYSQAQRLFSVLPAPDLGRIYGGGQSLTAFDFQSGNKLWTRATTTVDPDLRVHALGAGYRDLERDGSTIWAACGCDWVNGNPVKALVKLDTEGNLDTSWSPQGAGTGAFGISVTQTSDHLYLGAGGSDFLAKYAKAGTGTRIWRRDVSGSAQVVEIMDGQLVAGGHFVEVADQASDYCGFRSPDPGTLDPNDECQRRDGLAIYSFDGQLNPTWDPALTGKYNLAWALLPEATSQGTRLHVGGEFTRVNGVRQEYYARLSP
jgi:hypothetical protein